MNALTTTRATAHVHEVTSPLGIKAYLVEAPAVPFISMDMVFRGGSTLDPAGEEGCAHLAAALLDEGAGPYDSQAFRAELEDNAIHLGFDADKQSLFGHLRTLNATRDHAIELLRLALNEPRFDDEPVARVKAQVHADLARRESDPGNRAQRAWAQAAFEGHPYARPAAGTVGSVPQIRTETMRALVKGRLTRDNLIVAVSGAITPDDLASLLDRAFGDLPGTGTPIRFEPRAPLGPKLVVETMAIPQSIVIFGHAGIGQDDSDYPAANVANYLLGGGGFSSRFMEEVREKRGLAYSVHASLQDSEGAPLWIGMVATSNERVAESLRLIREETARFAAGEVTQAELDDAKTYLTGSFPLRLTSNDQVAAMLITMQRRKLGRDYLERRNGLIEAVTLDDLKRVAARMFHADKLIVAAAGQPVGLAV